MPGPVDVFISHAAQDDALRDELEMHVASLKRDGLIRAWHTGLLVAGDDRQLLTAERLQAARVVVLLVSAAYIADDLWEREMEPALARGRDGTALVIPVLVRTHDWARAPFADLAPLPSNRIAVTAWPDRDAAWANVAQGIREAVEKLGVSPARLPTPVPRFENERIRRLAAELENAQVRQRELRAIGAGTATVDEEVLDLRRKLRDGGRLRAGDALGDGQYRLLEQVGRGGFATVWSAFDRDREEKVAVKVLHPQFAEDPVRFERFFRGARVMARLGHEAVVRVLHEQAEDGGWLYFVMELLAGGDLRRAVLQGKVTAERVVPLLLGVGGALAAAHGRGIVHRDVKPANVLLDAAGEPRLTDFDLVSVGDTTGGTKTGALGSWLYTAPEQMHDAREVDARADVYSLGMTALFCLHGRELPVAVTRRPETVIARLACSEGVKEVVGRAIEVEPRDRYEDAGAFCEALRQAAAGLEKRSPTTPSTVTRTRYEWAGALPNWKVSKFPLSSISKTMVLRNPQVESVNVTTWLESISGQGTQAGRQERKEEESSREPSEPLRSSRALAPLRETPGSAPTSPATPMTTLTPDLIDIGIVIALPEELRELLGMVADYTPQPDDDLDSFLFTRGNYRCAATLVGHMGEAQATRVAERLIAAFDPGSILSVGIAAGVHDDLRIGDVHVPSQAVQYMQDGKASPAEPGGFVIVPGAPAYRADFTLHKAVIGLEFNHRRGHQAWREACRADLEALITDAEARERLFTEKVVRPEVKLLADGHVATGPVVGAAPAFAAWVRSHDRNVKSLEMESAAVLLAAQTRRDAKRALAIRGISDGGDHNKATFDALGEGALRKYAMRNAVRFLFALLEADTLPRNPR